MMNKKLIALFVAVATVSVISAGWYDEDGNYHHGIRPHHVVGDTTRGAGYAAERTVEGTADVAAGVISAPFGGRGPVERVEDRRADREARREERRMEREERRAKYNRE